MPAKLWNPLTGNKVQCVLCAHQCVIGEGNAGLCGVRANRRGQLHSLVESLIASVNMDPVEKKPLYHYRPGNRTLSFGTVGCNFACKFCQNHAISRAPHDRGTIQGKRVTPDILVQEALAHDAGSLSFTYNEPTVFFELMYETAGKAAARGLDCLLVTNGFQSEECLSSLYRRIKAVNVDLKSMREAFYREYCQARLDPVLQNLKLMRHMGWWVEVTTLLIPGVNDSEEELKELALFLCQELGPHTPWHISRFHGAYKMQDHAPTPLSLLERARGIGHEAGLHYVYIGNVGGGPGANTTCPACGKTCITRQGFSAKSYLKGQSCPGCGRNIEGIWS